MRCSSVPETMNDRDEEFGEMRLQHALKSGPNLSASDLLSRVLDEVRTFSAGKQSDDITIILGRAK